MVAPITQLASDVAPPAGAFARPPGRKPYLLIVDDEEGPRQSLHIIFRDDYEVLLAEGGEAAIALLRRYPVDAAILDIRMPGMTGIEVLSRLKEISPAVEVIMLTAYETVETARQAIRFGACDYLAKPFELEAIRSAVARAMTRRALTEEISANSQKLLELGEEIHAQRLKEEISRTKGEIYASILHDINGPLSVICGYLEMMNEIISHAATLDASDVEQLRGHLGQANRQVTKCVEISRRYLSFLRKASFENATVLANPVLNDLVELLRVHPAARNHDLVYHPLTEDVTALINGTDLIQMLLNLGVNAFQCSTTAHRVEIYGQCLRHSLDLTKLADGPGQRLINRDAFANRPPMIAISVRDNGPGISPEVLPRLFETYFTTKSAEQGTGLGLAIVHRFVREANGAVLLQSRPGHGTVFTIYLPAQLAPPQRPQG